MDKRYIYEVPHRNHVATLKLTEDDAERLYGDRAKKVGEAKRAEAPEAKSQPWEVPASELDEVGAPVGSDDSVVPAERAGPAKNKARNTR